jgi:hypothetical protein
VGAAAVGVVAAAEDGGDTMTTRTSFDCRGTFMKTCRTAIALALAMLAAFAPGPGTGALAADAPARKAPPKAAQAAYATLEDAASALYEAMKTEDLKRIYSVLGPGSGALIYTGDDVDDAETRGLFVAAYDKSAKFDRQGDAAATLLIGPDDYPFPYPLVKKAQGWMFDARAGAEEIVNRRIGENELAAIQSCLAFSDAQREYVLKDRDRSGALEYARKIVSSRGKQDGLYWPTADGEPPSPLGPLAAEAGRQGYKDDSRAFHGYEFKVLTAQGKAAPGGAYNYVVNGKMIGGFAFVAWPARWGVSGVMSFICNHDGVVYQKNLGENTTAIAMKMTQYNPDSTWAKAQP